MSLKKFVFSPIYSKDKNDLYKEFYKKCIESSIKYDRMTGYFGSSIFVVILEGLKTFLENSGKIRIICSPVMSEDDYNAILKGYSERTNEIITTEIIKEIENLATNYPKPFELLSTLIKHGVLEIKLALFKGHLNPSYSQLVHDKIGFFTDKDENVVAFGGSMNETFSGISNEGNLESFSVYTNWEDEKDKLRVKNYVNRFNEIWNKKSESVITFDFPEEASKLINKYSSNSEIKTLLNNINFDENIEINLIYEKWYAEKGKDRRKARPHQIAVLDNWERNNNRGIFEMATGSGKTFTAMCAIRKSLEDNKIPLIIVPSSILLGQWKEEVDKVFVNENINVLLCGANNSRWKNNNTLNNFSNPLSNTKRIIISTIQTAYSDEFINRIYMGNHLFLIVDEVHRSGSKAFRNIFRINSGRRIGLSATPHRFRDPEGTEIIYNYFENEIEPKYDLFQAIKDKNLTPYDYDFVPVYLTKEEQEEWDEFTKVINRNIAVQLSNNNSELLIDSRLEMLLIKRARIVKKAENKIDVVLNILKKHYKIGQSWLIYCEDEKQLRTVYDLLGEYDYRKYMYIADMDSHKPETLNAFERNSGILVSIKCLDEGVDIPAVSHAIILSSSTNPREYIQRRGRVLRKSKGKELSYIFDCITLPNQENYEEDQSKGLSIIKSEIARALKFAEFAENRINSIYKLKEIAIKYNIDLIEDGDGGFENG